MNPFATALDRMLPARRVNAELSHQTHFHLLAAVALGGNLVDLSQIEQAVPIVVRKRSRPGATDFNSPLPPLRLGRCCRAIRSFATQPLFL
jgi:hypothetical protein